MHVLSCALFFAVCVFFPAHLASKRSGEGASEPLQCMNTICEYYTIPHVHLRELTTEHNQASLPNDTESEGRI